MKIEQKTREIIAAVFVGLVILGLTGLLFAAAVKGYHNSIVDLDKADKFEGTIVDRDIVLKRGKVNLNVFYFKQDGLPDRLASYNIQQDYQKLLDNLNVGDKITVYFKKSESKKLNLDVIQIEKQSQVILDKSEFETKKSSLIYIGTIGGTIMLGLFAGMIVKLRKVLILPPTKDISHGGTVDI